MNLHELPQKAYEATNNLYSALVMAHSNIITGNLPFAHNLELDYSQEKPYLNQILEKTSWFISNPTAATASVIGGIVTGILVYAGIERLGYEDPREKVSESMTNLMSHAPVGSIMSSPNLGKINNDQETAIRNTNKLYRLVGGVAGPIAGALVGAVIRTTLGK